MFEHDGSDARAQARAWLDAVVERHIPNLTRRQAQVLALQALGLSESQVASRLGIELRTVQHHAHEAHGLVVPDGAEPTRANAQLWSYLHVGCCLAREWKDLLGDAETVVLPPLF